MPDVRLYIGPATFYGITASVRDSDDPWESFRQVPTFYLLDTVQGIQNEEHAKSVALDVLNLKGEDKVEGRDYHVVVHTMGV